VNKKHHRYAREATCQKLDLWGRARSLLDRVDSRGQPRSPFQDPAGPWSHGLHAASSHAVSVS
jgi:hypothetical protein